ncbi:hypothetical protein FQA39_LY07679 [Lamprigera yunnana]|nr:hypothetical protein FQA39_LY07679 [Lamprigera yunnana]
MSINEKINELKSYVHNDEVLVMDMRMIGMGTLQEYGIWSWCDIRKSKYIIIDEFGRFPLINALPYVWGCEIDDPIFLLQDTKNNSVRVFTSHPRHPLNECGKSGKFVQEHDCNNLETIKNRYLSWGLHGCKVSYLHNMKIPLDRFHSEENVVMDLILDTVRNNLNATVAVEDKSKPSDNPIFVSRKKVNECGCSTCSNLFLREKFVWTVPSPKNVSSNMNLKRIIWIFSILSFLLIEISWWVISKYVKKTNVSSLLAKKFSVTLVGSVYRIPKRFVLRCGFLVCAIYILCFQTVVTSDLTQMMMSSQFQPKIRTVEELAQSKISIIVNSNMKLLEYSKGNYLQAVSNTATFEKYSVFASMNDVSTMAKIFKAKVHIIVDSSITEVKAKSMGVRWSSRIVPSLNKVVSTLHESGLINHREKMYRNYVKNNTRHSDTTFADKKRYVLSLKDVYPAFIIWGVGVALSLIVFIIEHKVNERKLIVVV